jgi:hypothetical protein
MSAPTIVQIVVPPDQFSKNFDSKSKSGLSSGRGVRRPTNGIVLKDDTFATIQVVARNGATMATLIDAGARKGDGKTTVQYGDRTTTDTYTNFFLQSVSENREEKQQIMETFGDPYIFFFGQRARVMQFQGVLLNTWDFNWEAEWWDNYENYLRGTRCVENDARLYLQYDNVMIGGYIIGCASQKQAEQRNFTTFSFTMFITDYTNLSNPTLGDPQSRGSDWASKRGAEPSPSSEALDYLERPTLIKSGFDAPNLAVTKGEDGKYHVSQGFLSLTRTGPRTLADAWRESVGAVNQFFDRVEQVVNGTVVRVPVGFEGSMAFDKDEVTTLKAVVTPSQTIAYTVFQQNDEEYLDNRGAYVRSLRRQDGSRWGDIATSDTGGGLYVDVGQKQAKDFWAKQGIDANPTLLVQFSRIAQGARLGLIVANLAYSVATFDRQPSVSLVEPPFKARQGGNAVGE